MKDRFKRMWIENKSKNKKPEEVIKNDTAKALEKMISILSKSDTPELIKTNQKLNLIKKKVWKEIRHQQQKEKEIQTIKEQIGQKTKTPCTLILKQQLKILKNPEPLEPLEMVDALLSLPKPPRYKISSIKKVSERIDELEKTSNFNTEDLIYAASELTSTVLTTPIKYKIDLRQKFLTETLGSLSIVTKLPNKPGDQENISGIVKNLQESFKGVFTHDQELYKKQVDLLAESLQLLLRIRGELKAWVDVDKFVKQYKITDGQLARMIKNAKEPNGSGIFSFLGGQDVNKLSNLLDITLTLTQDHRLFYKTIIKPHKKDNLILKLTKHKEALQQKINLVFQSSVQKQYFPYNNTNNIKLPIVSEHLTKLQLAIINSIFNQQNTLIDQISPLSVSAKIKGTRKLH